MRESPGYRRVDHDRLNLTLKVGCVPYLCAEHIQLRSGQNERVALETVLFSPMRPNARKGRTFVMFEIHTRRHSSDGKTTKLFDNL
jgi:hypothetical protein